MTTRLILVCHASTTATRETRCPDDESLDPRGRAQAAAAAGTMHRLDQVRRGPEARCQETAAGMGLNAEIDPALADLDLGAWRGQTLAQLEHTQPAAVQAWLTDPSASPHGGESLHDLLNRIARWLDGLPGTTGRIAAITHPSVIRAAVVHALAGSPDSFWRLDVAPLSHTRLSCQGNRWTVRETGHPITDDHQTPE